MATISLGVIDVPYTEAEMKIHVDKIAKPAKAKRRKTTVKKKRVKGSGVKKKVK